MSNWTPKRALYGLMSRFRRSGSGESSSYSSDEEQAEAANRAPMDADEIAISPLALMSESSPEAWLGQFLLMLEIQCLGRHGTLEGAKRDAALRESLVGIRDRSGVTSAAQLFDESYAERLKREDWAAWWRLQDTMTRYCYSTLALALLGDKSHLADLSAMFNQRTNTRVQRDAHFVLCFLLDKDWPAYQVTQADLRRLDSESIEATEK